jgi:hypothetical protein
MTWRRLLKATCLGLSALALLGAGPAAADPVWNLGMHHNETNFPPGGKGEVWLDIDNIGDTPTTGPITVTFTLQNGLTRETVIKNDETLELKQPGVSWKCPGSPGDTTIVCTSNNLTIPRHTVYRGLRLSVNVSPSARGDRFVSAKLAGGGAAATVTALEKVHIDSRPAGFGVVPESFTPGFWQSDQATPVQEAGAHPALVTFPFDVNTVSSPTAEAPRQKAPTEPLRDLEVVTPPGFIGNPTAVNECTQAQFTIGECPLSSQVGRIDYRIYPISSLETQSFSAWNTGVFNLSHPRGKIVDLGLAILGNPIHIKVSLDPANEYAIRSSVPQINELAPVFDQKLTLWGVPADSSHDSERCRIFTPAVGNGLTDEECATDQERRPFLTVPSQCGVEHLARLQNYDSWEHIGAFGSEITYAMSPSTNCERPRFEPEVEVEPTGNEANTPTGLDVHVQVAQNENPNALATPPVKSTVITLPDGMSFSPSFADGLQSCTMEQFGISPEGTPNENPVACPDASRIGEVRLSTPLLPEVAEGSMFLARQGENPFGTLFALYLTVHDTEERGVLLKIPGRIDVDPDSGQITASFDRLPQFPFDDFTLKFRSGPRAPLVNPPTCGTHEISVRVASYAQPNAPVDASNSYRVSEGPGGGGCESEQARLPFAPKFNGGSLNPIAGAYSTFLFRLSRSDAEQELERVTTFLPPGLLAKIAGIPFCSPEAIASISSELGTSAGEQANSACPAASRIGTISAGLGAGPGPNYFSGSVYLSGPYKDAPLSLAIVVPGLAGPFDLGNTVVRVALRVNPDTSRVTAVSDPFPRILHGVILRVRDVRMRLDRPDTIINPTNCTPTSLQAQIFGGAGALFGASDRYQVGDCGRLAFKPSFSFRLKGGTHRGDFPAFTARVRGRTGDANIGKAVVALPHSEFLEQSHIGTVCTRVQFAADACPAASVYGHAKAVTPLLDQPVEGDVVLRSSDNLLPDLVARLRGQISTNLVGRIDSVKGGIRTSFASVPDVPITEFTLSMTGGKKGLLVNSTNLCLRPHRVDVKLTSQSNRFLRQRPELKAAGCKAKKKNKGKRKGKR